MTDANCPTCDETTTQYAKRHAAAWARFVRLRDAVCTEYDAAWTEYERDRDTAWTEYKHVLDAHPHHAEATQ